MSGAGLSLSLYYTVRPPDVNSTVDIFGCLMRDSQPLSSGQQAIQGRHGVWVAGAGIKDDVALDRARGEQGIKIG